MSKSNSMHEDDSLLERMYTRGMRRSSNPTFDGFGCRDVSSSHLSVCS